MVCKNPLSNIGTENETPKLNHANTTIIAYRLPSSGAFKIVRFHH